MPRQKSIDKRADGLKEQLQSKLWDPKRSFLFPMSMKDEVRDGEVVKALTLTYQSGKYADSPHGRELIGYVPWQFNLPDQGKNFEAAWKFLTDPQYFQAPYGPTSVEQQDTQFILKNSCCWWSGQSWPYATTQTLKALANLLQNYDQSVISKNDYQAMLNTYSLSHRKDGKPYLAEALHPATGSFEGHDAYNHSEHYFHSGFCDLVITGLVDLKPRPDNVIEIHPLANDAWGYFALDDLNYHGQRVSIIWARDGSRYGKGAGLQILVKAHRATIVQFDATDISKVRLTIKHQPGRTSGLPEVEMWGDATLPVDPAPAPPGNLAFNRGNKPYPKMTASHTSRFDNMAFVNDGRIVFTPTPANRWTTYESTTPEDWLQIEFEAPTNVGRGVLHIYDDRGGVQQPAEVRVQYRSGEAWKDVVTTRVSPEKPKGSVANTISCKPVVAKQMLVVFVHKGAARSGLTELELWEE
jgi:hypothetical protein